MTGHDDFEIYSANGESRAPHNNHFSIIVLFVS